MKQALKWGAIICVSLVVIVIAALVIISLLVDVNQYKPEIEKLVSDATQRSFKIGDEIDLSLFPWAGVSLAERRVRPFHPPGPAHLGRRSLGGCRDANRRLCSPSSGG